MARQRFSAPIAAGSVPDNRILRCIRIFAMIGAANMFLLSNVQAGPFDQLINSVKSVLPTNLFDSTESDFNKLVDANEFEKSLVLFDEKYTGYFDRRFNTDRKEITPQLKKLGAWYLEKNYSQKIDDITARLKSIDQLVNDVDGLWIAASSAIGEGQKLIEDFRSNNLLKTSKAADSVLTQLETQLEVVDSIAKRDRAAAFNNTLEKVFLTGIVDANYPFSGFKENDYVNSEIFQKKILNELQKSTSNQKTELLKKLQNVISNSVVSKIDKDTKLKESLASLGAAPYSIDKIVTINNLLKDFGNDSGLQNALKIGYIDLSTGSQKDRHAFDFDLIFEKDYSIAVQDAREDILVKSTTAGYDYIFVTDLSLAKITREFKNKRNIQSKVQVGTRQEPNPDYVSAVSEYQRALTNMQTIKLQNAASINQPCSGGAWACALLGMSKGMDESNAEKNFKAKSATLAQTPQTITKPVYSPYDYQLVDVNVSKNARIDYYVIDVKKKQLYTNHLDVQNNEKFTVTYNVQKYDPDAVKITNDNRREEDVVAWETKPVNVNLSDLFDLKGLSQTRPRPWVSIDAFLKPLATRQYASVSPNYGLATTTKPEAKNELKNSASVRNDSGVIADERFDSVLYIKTPKGLGAGFYVTPDLVLTAYHVVEGFNLVELTLYNGTKTHGKVVDSDVRLDLALIKTPIAGKPVKIHSGPIKLGETTEAIGHPKGFAFTITRGVLSSVRKGQGPSLQTGLPVEFVQTDTPISPGNSGGPLYIKDAVIGVNDWVRVDKASQNLNFSISFNEIRDYLSRFEGKR